MPEAGGFFCQGEGSGSLWELTRFEFFFFSKKQYFFFLVFVFFPGLICSTGSFRSNQFQDLALLIVYIFANLFLFVQLLYFALFLQRIIVTIWVASA